MPSYLLFLCVSPPVFLLWHINSLIPPCSLVWPITKLRYKGEGYVKNFLGIFSKDNSCEHFTPFPTHPSFYWLECRHEGWSWSSHLGIKRQPYKWRSCIVEWQDSRHLHLRGQNRPEPLYQTSLFRSFAYKIKTIFLGHCDFELHYFQLIKHHFNKWHMSWEKTSGWFSAWWARIDWILLGSH